MAIPKKLKTRWQIYSEELSQVRELTKDFTQSPFGFTEEGLLDFRGIYFGNPKEVPAYEVIHIDDLSLCNADFSGSVWRGVVLWSTDKNSPASIKNVVFDQSSFETWFGAKDYLMENCSFTDCKYKDVHFYCHSINRCNFENIKKSSRFTFSIDKMIENCRFTGEMVKVNFWQSPMQNCIFEGRLYDCSFAGVKNDHFKELVNNKRPKTIADLDNRMLNIDFSKADLVVCNFSHYIHLDLVKPSPNNCILKLTDEFYSELQKLIKQKAGTLTEEMLNYIPLFCKPHEQIPYRCFYKEDNRYKSPEFNKLYYELICEAAKNTNTRICDKQN